MLCINVCLNYSISLWRIPVKSCISLKFFCIREADFLKNHHHHHVTVSYLHQRLLAELMVVIVVELFKLLAAVCWTIVELLVDWLFIFFAVFYLMLSPWYTVVCHHHHQYPNPVTPPLPGPVIDAVTLLTIPNCVAVLFDCQCCAANFIRFCFCRWLQNHTRTTFFFRSNFSAIAAIFSPDGLGWTAKYASRDRFSGAAMEVLFLGKKSPYRLLRTFFFYS